MISSFLSKVWAKTLLTGNYSCPVVYPDDIDNEVFNEEGRIADVIDETLSRLGTTPWDVTVRSAMTCMQYVLSHSSCLTRGKTTVADVLVLMPESLQHRAAAQGVTDGTSDKLVADFVDSIVSKDELDPANLALYAQSYISRKFSMLSDKNLGQIAMILFWLSCERQVFLGSTQLSTDFTDMLRTLKEFRYSVCRRMTWARKMSF